MRIIHSADWHLDAPFAGRSPEETESLRQALLSVPGKVAELCVAKRCDLVLLSGDLFDGAYSRESYRCLYDALKKMAVPVFVSPGNHDFCGPDSPWLRETWPENVHIFTAMKLQSIFLPELDCRVYGAGYQSMDCPGLLEYFSAEGGARYKIGILHADPTQRATPYCPMTAEQIRQSGFDYLALGHIHKGGSFRAGKTLCAWPGCPMGRGYDETGEKGALLVELAETVETEFVPLGLPCFYDLQTDAGANAAAAVARLLPPAGSDDYYRITLTGYADGVDAVGLRSEFEKYPHLQIRDKTVPESDLWGAAGEDSLEGLYFGMLRDAADGQDEQLRRRAMLAAKISRQILDGQEVKLP